MSGNRTKKWNILREEQTINYNCGESQTTDQLLQCPLTGTTTCDNNYLLLANVKAAVLVMLWMTMINLNSVKEVRDVH